MRDRLDEFAALGARIVAVSFEEADQILRFASDERLPFPLLGDPERWAYQAFGLQPASWRQLTSWATIATYLRGMLHGRWPRIRAAQFEQLGGDFVLDATGRIVLCWKSETPADRPAIDDLLSAVRAATSIEDAHATG